MSEDKRPMAFIALALLLGALLVPFVIAALGRADLALGFAIVAGVLALILGAFSRSKQLGRFVTTSILVLLITAAMIAALFTMIWRNKVATKLETQSQRERLQQQSLQPTRASFSGEVAAPRITGLVRDLSGNPAAGVAIAFYPGSYLGTHAYPETKTDATGHYALVLRLEALTEFWGPVNPTNSIMARDFKRNLAAILEFTGTPTNIDLNLRPGITLSGAVKDPQGRPITNASVEPRFLSGAWVTKLKDGSSFQRHNKRG